MLKLAGELIEGQLADHIARLDAHTYEAFSILRTGEYYVGHISGDHYDVSYGANKLHAAPLVIPRNIAVDRIAIDVEVAGGAGTHARLGIYENGTNVYPGSLLLDAGEVDITSTGIKAITIDQALTKGLYWVVFVTDDASMKICGLANHPSVPPLGLQSNAFHVMSGHWRVDFTYGALPDPFTAGGSLNYASPLIAVRVASLD